MSLFTQHNVHDLDQGPLADPFFRKHGYTQAPVVLQCYVTLWCDLACPHCLADHGDAETFDMPVALFEKLCREAANCGVEEMLLTGGEPLLRNDLGVIISILKEHGLSWTLNTARCPDAEQQMALRDYSPAFVAVSVDGPAHVHNAFRKSPHAFKGAMDAIQFFASLPATRTCAGTTITTENLPFFDDTFREIRESGADHWGIHLLVPEGRAAARPDFFPTDRQMRELLKNIAVKRQEFSVSLSDEMGFAGEWEPLVRDTGFFCAAGRAMCAVLPDGSVMPCSTLDPQYCEGNVSQEPLTTIWGERFSSQRSLKATGKCARCRDRAICGGGCWLQRIHGAHCFKHLWKIPESFKKTAALALCFSSLSAAGEPSSDAPGPLLLIPGLYTNKGGYPRKQLPQEVQKSLSWLQKNQNKDGSWGTADSRAECTSLGLLAFMAHGERPSSEKYGTTVQKGLQWLANWELTHKKGTNPRIDAILGWSLATAYRMTEIPFLKPAMDQSLSRLSVKDITPWHVLAWTTAYHFYHKPLADRELIPSADELRKHYSFEVEDLTDKLLRCLIEFEMGDKQKASDVFAQLSHPGGSETAIPAETEKRAMTKKQPSGSPEPEIALKDWRQADDPLMAALLIKTLNNKLWRRTTTLLAKDIDQSLTKLRKTHETEGRWDPADIDIIQAQQKSLNKLRGGATTPLARDIDQSLTKLQKTQETDGWWEKASIDIIQASADKTLSEEDERIRTTSLITIILAWEKSL